MSSPSNRPPYLLDAGTRRLGDGRLLLGGEPPRLFRLSERGAQALESALSEGGPAGLQADRPSEQRLLARLSTAGLIQPQPEPVSSLPHLTIVIPVRQPAPHLGELLARLSSCGAGSVVVVDDGSDDGGAKSTAIAQRHGARVLRRPLSGGPAAARNSAEVETEFVVYLDADTVLGDREPLRWLSVCLAHFSDPRLGVVAPRICSLPGRGAVARYEESSSPLDLGERPGLVGSFRRLSYVPATALVARARALKEIGGFDGSLRFGEDVDLVRRLGVAGWRVRYEPAAVVSHQPRRSLASLARQRFGYGTAAAELDRRHGGTVPPFAASPSAFLASAGALGAGGGLLLGKRAAALGALSLFGASRAVSVIGLGRKLAAAGCPAPYRLADELVESSVRSAIWALLRAVRRCWWPFVVPLLLMRRTRSSAGLLLFSSALARFAPGSWPRRSPIGLLETSTIGLVDDLSYTGGVLAGCWRVRSLRVLLPRLVRSRPTARSG